MYCECNEWQENINKVNEPLHNEVARNPQNYVKDNCGVIIAYTGVVFKYCPWCGNELNV